MTKGSQVIGRTLKREITSRGYILLLKLVFWARFSDAQCGFKALSRRAVDELVPLVEDTGWFFDTELLLIAERNRYRVHDVPVLWRDDPDTRVNIVKTVLEDLRGVWRLRVGGMPKTARG